MEFKVGDIIKYHNIKIPCYYIITMFKPGDVVLTDLDCTTSGIIFTKDELKNFVLVTDLFRTTVFGVHIV